MIVNPGQQYMGCHYCFNININSCHKGLQFESLQPFQVKIKHRQADMGIDIRIAVTGKMLDYGDNPTVTQPFCRLYSYPCYHIRVIAVSPAADDRIEGIAVNIKHRGKIKVKPEYF